MAMDLQADNGNDAKHGRMERANGALFAKVRPRRKGVNVTEKMVAKVRGQFARLPTH